ncbi:MAG: hypothetical protein Alpg2KO_30090 [Alphaproteobacteria bacterium]
MTYSTPFESWITSDPIAGFSGGSIEVSEAAGGTTEAPDDSGDGDRLDVTLTLDATRFTLDQALDGLGFEDWVASEIATSRLSHAAAWLAAAQDSKHRQSWNEGTLLELCEMIASARDAFGELAGLTARRKGSDQVVMVEDPYKLASDLHALTVQLHEQAEQALPEICDAAGNSPDTDRRKRQIRRDLTGLCDDALRTLKAVI